MKRNCIKALPHTLVMHLKRFEFDYETMARLKIKDRRAERTSACSLPVCCFIVGAQLQSRYAH